MNLNTMSNVHFNISGNATGFKLKSKASGRIFTAVNRTPGGRFLIVSECGEKEDLVQGEADRYEFADPKVAATAGRKAEINERMVQLMNKEGELETELKEIQDQIGELELELDTLDGANNGTCPQHCEM